MKLERMIGQALLFLAGAILPASSLAWEQNDIIGQWSYHVPREVIPEDKRADVPELISSFDFWPGEEGVKGYYVNFYKIRDLAEVKLEKDVLSVKNEAVAKGANGGSGPIDKKKNWTPTFDYQGGLRNDPDFKPLVFKFSAIPTDKDLSDDEITGDYNGELVYDLEGKLKTVRYAVSITLASGTKTAGGKVKIKVLDGPKQGEVAEHPILLIHRFHNRIYVRWDKPSGKGSFLGTLSSGKLNGVMNTEFGNGRASLIKAPK